mmetsp:Transcript_23210/g.54777  ORF Transcript_23210/g.54777 Transcript_23210/m.54777 type:complete len:125 (-) Transcript_23210:1501-1875(-)
MTTTDDEQHHLMNGTSFTSLEHLTNIIKSMYQTRDNESQQTGRDDQRSRSVTQQSVVSLLPPEIVRNIAMYFTVKKLDPSKTRVLRCSSSSSSNHHELRECLVDSTSSWWISSFGSFDNGVYLR